MAKSPHQRMARAQRRKRGWMYWRGALKTLRRRKVRTPRVYRRNA